MGTPSTATPIRKWKLPPPFFPNSSSVKRIPFSPATKTPKKLLLLTDWWLIKTDDVTPPLEVAGTTRTESTIRTFHSGEIVKRHDEVTLETKDGFTITLVGLINRLRTLQNGIPLEVCNHFVLGFPYDWEEIGAQCFGEGTTCGAPSKRIGTIRLEMSQNGAKSMLPLSFDDLPVTRVRDLMMLPSGDYTESRINQSIFDHMVTTYSCSSVHLNDESDGQTMAKDPVLKEARPSPDSNEENNRLVTTKNCLLDKYLTNQVTNKAGKRHKNDSTIIEIEPGREKESQSMHNYIDSRWLHRGVCTRSKERFKKSNNNKEEGLSSNTFTRSVSTTEALWSNWGGKIAEKNTSTVIVGDSVSYAVHSESTMIVNSYNQSKGHLLRSKSKSQTLKNNSKEDGLHSKTFTPSVSTSKASRNHCGGSMAETNVNPLVIMSEQHKEISNVLGSRPGISRSGKRRRVDSSVFARGEHSSGLSVNDQAEIFSSTTRNANLTEQISISEVLASRCGVSVTRTNASRSCLLDKPSQDHRERTLYEPVARLSNQLNNSSTGIFTRSKARLNRLRSNAIENTVEVEVPVGDSAVIRCADNSKVSVSSPTSEAFDLSKKSASSRELFSMKKQTIGAPDGCALRRSNRIRNQKAVIHNLHE